MVECLNDAVAVVQWKLPEAERSRHSVAATCSSALLHPVLHSMVLPLDMEVHHHVAGVR